ncbi:MAG: hypothetical protein HRK26_01605 [Rickettsiaceae bacterium H1]|nr:hypothetical protein [Rickettsiaceae bacterium H1]
MVDLFSEVKHEAKTEKLVKVLRNYVLPLVILVIIAGVIYGIRINRSEYILALLGDKMYEVISSDANFDKKEKLLREVTEYDYSYKYLAELKLADLMLQNGKEDEAKELYSKLIKDKKSLGYIRDLAEQRLMIISGEKVKSNNMYYFSNILLQAIKEENNEEKLTLLKNLKENFETHLPIKELAKEILAVYN